MKSAARNSICYFPPVISAALNFDGGGAGEPENETYCMRKSANNPSIICASWASRLPRVFCSSMPSISIQCFAVFKSTPVSPVTGWGIMPSEAAAFDARDMIKLTKLAGSSRGSRPGRDASVVSAEAAAAPVCSDRGAGCGCGLGCAAVGCGTLSSLAAGLDSSVFVSSGESSRGVPSGLKGRRSTTLNVGCCSLIFFE